MSLGSSSSLKSTLRFATLGLALVAVAACGDDPVEPNPVQGSGVDITLSATSVKLIRSVEVPNPTATVTGEVKGTTNTALTWTSGDPRIATVSSSGVITGLVDGSTFVTVTSAADPTVNRTVVVNVVSTVVNVNPPTDFLYVGGPTRTITHTIENNTNTAVTWSSSDPAIATVSSTGVVTPVAAGNVNIIATSVADPTKQAASQVRVDAAPHDGFTQAVIGTTYPISGTTGDVELRWFYVPRGTTSVKIAVAGSNGDADLNVMTGAASEAQIFGYSSTNRGCFSAAGGSNESCTINNPAPRLYYLMVHAYETYSGATLTITTTN